LLQELSRNITVLSSATTPAANGKLKQSRLKMQNTRTEVENLQKRLQVVTKSLADWMQLKQALEQKLQNLLSADASPPKPGANMTDAFKEDLRQLKRTNHSNIRLGQEVKSVVKSSRVLPNHKANCCVHMNRLSPTSVQNLCKLLPGQRTLREIASLKRSCFGAIGQGCSKAKPYTKKKRLSSSPHNPDASNSSHNYVSISVSVGSIMHDACCAKFPHGQMCSAGVTAKRTDHIGWPDRCARARVAQGGAQPRRWLHLASDRAEVESHESPRAA